jgi:hypothetical protein
MDGGIGMGLLRGVALALILIMSGAIAAKADAPPVWAERMQIIYNPETRSVSRLMVRVVDPHPEKNLEFVWEPARGNWPGIDPQSGAASGPGRLVWRVRGSAGYDPKTIYSTYEGTLADGRPGGRGTLRIRSGELFKGEWKAGLLDGPGSHRDAQGNHYEGEFRSGLPHGKGIWRGRDGSIYEGPFVGGLRHGVATMRLPGGTVYQSQWIEGREVGQNRPDVAADALIGGLLTAQSGGDAGKVEISVVVDQRMTDQYDVKYQHLVRDEDIAVYPVSDYHNDAWNGTGDIPYEFEVYWEDWENDFAFLEAELATTDGSKVRLDALSLDVASSEAYRKPMLTYVQHMGCIGFRPDFQLRNHGWGDVRNPRMSVRFSGHEEGGAQSPAYDVPLQGFEHGVDVSLLDLFRQAGVDTDSLATRRFQCPSFDQLGGCAEKLFDDIEFGDLDDYVGFSTEALLPSVLTHVSGQLDYEWADDAGNLFSVSEPFSAQISLAVIETDFPMAESGDFGFMPPTARRYVDIQLPVGESDYSIDIPFRGNSNISEYIARLKVSAEMSSLHKFRVSSRFADGSVRYSKPLTLFYFKPRTPNFTSITQDLECTLY